MGKLTKSWRSEITSNKRKNYK